jgi:hypothetical protein
MMRLVPVCLSLVLIASAALAQDAKKEPAMDPAMMEAMMKAGMPGEPHKQLDAFVGTWNTQLKFWMAPGTDPATSTGISENRWILGGRALEQRFRGEAMGEAFEGVGYTGYDNVKKQYWGVWMDSMSTAAMLSTGTRSGNVYSFTGAFPDPMTGKDQKIDEKMTIVDADHHVLEMWGPGPDGKTFKTMEIAYSRKK